MVEHVVLSCALHFIPKVKVGTLRKSSCLAGLGVETQESTGLDTP